MEAHESDGLEHLLRCRARSPFALKRLEWLTVLIPPPWEMPGSEPGNIDLRPQATLDDEFAQRIAW